MKKEKVVIEIGNEFTIDFMKNNQGGKPVGRIDGVVCFIDKSSRDFVTPTSSWICSVISLHDSFITVKPLLQVRTAKDNKILYESKLEVLKTQHLKKKRVKVVKNYQYRTFAELQLLKTEEETK